MRAGECIERHVRSSDKRCLLHVGVWPWSKRCMRDCYRGVILSHRRDPPHRRWPLWMPRKRAVSKRFSKPPWSDSKLAETQLRTRESGTFREYCDAPVCERMRPPSFKWQIVEKEEGSRSVSVEIVDVSVRRCPRHENRRERSL